MSRSSRATPGMPGAESDAERWLETHLGGNGFWSTEMYAQQRSTEIEFLRMFFHVFFEAFLVQSSFGGNNSLLKRSSGWWFGTFFHILGIIIHNNPN